MEPTQTTIGILNDLIQINNDRIIGYEKAIQELKDSDDDLKVLFSAMIDESRQARMALGTEVQALGGEMKSGTSTTNSGKIYKAWMDVKAVFTGHDRKTVLNNCEFGEDAAQKAYDAALLSEDLPAYLREMVSKQKHILKGSHDEIKALRDRE
jgi:uncharacterized protein (TIGR02284 family)